MDLSYEATSRTLKIDTGTLHYHVAGSGEPLILLHGSGPGVSGWSNFGNNLPAFAAHFRCYIVDLPGFGASEAIEGGHPMMSSPGAIVAFCAALGITRARFVGNSMGGGVAMMIALANPDLVERFVSIGGIGINIFSPMPPEGIRLLADFTETPSREALVRWLHSMVYDRSIITEALIEERFESAMRPEILAWSRKMYSHEALATIYANLTGANGTPLWANLARIRCPVLLAWGRDDRVTPVDMGLLPMRLIPRCELHTFYDCGHWAMIERKAEFESTALAFLQRPA